MDYGFWEKGTIDFLSTELWAIEEGEKIIKGNLENAEYLKAIDLPENMVNKLFADKKELKNADEDLKYIGKLLISVVG